MAYSNNLNPGIYKRILSLHAASIGINNSAILFCGPASCGKSTIARWLMKKQPVYGDEFAVLENKSDNSWIIKKAYSSKGYFPDGPIKVSKRLAAIIILKGHLPAKHKLSLCSETEAVKWLFKQTILFYVINRSFRKNKAYSDKSKKTVFLNLCRVAKEVPCYALEFSLSFSFWPHLLRILKDA